MECSVCKKSAELACKKCNQRYCGPECQTKDWPEHQVSCDLDIAGHGMWGGRYHRSGYRRAHGYGPYGRGWYGSGRFFTYYMLIPPPSLGWHGWHWLSGPAYPRYTMHARNQAEMEAELETLRRQNRALLLEHKNVQLIPNPKDGTYGFVKEEK